MTAVLLPSSIFTVIALSVQNETDSEDSFTGSSQNISAGSGDILNGNDSTTTAGMSLTTSEMPVTTAEMPFEHLLDGIALMIVVIVSVLCCFGCLVVGVIVCVVVVLVSQKKKTPLRRDAVNRTSLSRLQTPFDISMTGNVAYQPGHFKRADANVYSTISAPGGETTTPTTTSESRVVPTRANTDTAVNNYREDLYTISMDSQGYTKPQSVS